MSFFIGRALNTGIEQESIDNEGGFEKSLEVKVNIDMIKSYGNREKQAK